MFELQIILSILVIIITILAYKISNNSEFYRGQYRTVWRDFNITMFLVGIVALGVLSFVSKELLEVKKEKPIEYLFLFVALTIAHFAWGIIFTRLQNKNVSTFLKLVNITLAVYHLLFLVLQLKTENIIILPAIIWTVTVVYMFVEIYRQ